MVAMPSAASRSSSCSAALRLKASMRMPDGSAPRSTSSTTRLTRVLVLPEPAGARTRAGPRACSTAARWASSSRTASGPLAGLRGRGRGAPAPAAAGAPAARARLGETRAAARAAGGRCPRGRARPRRRRRGCAASSASAPNGKPRQNGSPRPTSGWTKRQQDVARPARRTPRPCPLQCQRPTGGSPPSRGRRGSPGSSVHERREAKRTPGAAAAARRARSRRLAHVEEDEPGPGGARRPEAAACRWSDRLSAAVLMAWPAGPACIARPATDASRPPRSRRG